MRFKLLIALIFFNVAPYLKANGVHLRFGPPAVGNGGPNPINLPPTALDSELTYTTDGLYEFSLSVTGLFVGKKEKSLLSGAGAISLGSGLVIDANGAGPGVYMALSTDFLCGFVCGSVELIQALGFANSGFISPYALRIGIGQWF